MATAYTPILKLALPVTGELNGAWGDVVNNNITSMVEQAVAGLATVNTWVAASSTLTTADGTTSQSRCAILECSGAPGAAATVICPAVSKVYIIKNSVTGGYAVTLKTSAGTGISVPNGSTALLYCDGTNVVSGGGLGGDVVGPASATDNAVARYDGTTGKIIQNSAVTIADDGATVIAANSASDGLRITQIGAGNALTIEDAANPDSSPTVIDGSGNVGIGLTNGTAKLTVAGTGAQNAVATATYIGSIQINESGSSSLQTTGGLEFKGSVFGAGYGSKIFSTDSGDLLFGNRNNSATWSESMRINSSGNVGIGSILTSAFFNATDQSARTFISYSSANTNVADATPTLALHNPNTTANNYSSIYFSTANSSATLVGTSAILGIHGTRDTGWGTGQLTFLTTASGASGPAERMRITSAGNVGIGTTTPAAKLAVVGTGYSPTITITDGATLNWDTSLGQVAQVTLGGNRTFAAPTNLVNGGFYSLLIIQDGTGSRTISWNAVFDFTGGVAPTLSTAAGAKDLITWRSDGTNMLEVGRSLGVA